MWRYGFSVRCLLNIYRNKSPVSVTLHCLQDIASFKSGHGKKKMCSANFTILWSMCFFEIHPHFTWNFTEFASITRFSPFKNNGKLLHWNVLKHSPAHIQYTLSRLRCPNHVIRRECSGVTFHANFVKLLSPGWGDKIIIPVCGRLQ